MKLRELKEAIDRLRSRVTEVLIAMDSESVSGLSNDQVQYLKGWLNNVSVGLQVAFQLVEAELVEAQPIDLASSEGEIVQ